MKEGVGLFSGWGRTVFWMLNANSFGVSKYVIIILQLNLICKFNIATIMIELRLVSFFYPLHDLVLVMKAGNLKVVPCIIPFDVFKIVLVLFKTFLQSITKFGKPCSQNYQKFFTNCSSLLKTVQACFSIF